VAHRLRAQIATADTVRQAEALVALSERAAQERAAAAFAAADVLPSQATLRAAARLELRSSLPDRRGRLAARALEWLYSGACAAEIGPGGEVVVWAIRRRPEVVRSALLT
jgi:hypothetical protein